MVMLIPQERVRQRIVEQTVDVPVVRQRQTPMTQKVPKTVEIQQTQFINRVVDVPVTAQRQVHTIQRVQTVEDVPQVKCSDKVVDVPVMMQRQVSTSQPVKKTRKVPQTQHIDKVAETLAATGSRDCEGWFRTSSSLTEWWMFPVWHKGRSPWSRKSGRRWRYHRCRM